MDGQHTAHLHNINYNTQGIKDEGNTDVQNNRNNKDSETVTFQSVAEQSKKHSEIDWSRSLSYHLFQYLRFWLSTFYISNNHQCNL